MNDQTRVGGRRAQAMAAGYATALGLVVALAPPLDFDPSPVPVTSVCRLCDTPADLGTPTPARHVGAAA